MRTKTSPNKESKAKSTHIGRKVAYEDESLAAS